MPPAVGQGQRHKAHHGRWRRPVRGQGAAGERGRRGRAPPRHCGTRGEGARPRAVDDAQTPERSTPPPFPLATRAHPTQAAARGVATHSARATDRCVAAGRPRRPSSFALPCRTATAMAAVVAAAECPTPAAAHAWRRRPWGAPAAAHAPGGRGGGGGGGERPPPFPVRVPAAHTAGPPRRPWQGRLGRRSGCHQKGCRSQPRSPCLGKGASGQWLAGPLRRGCQRPGVQHGSGRGPVLLTVTTADGIRRPPRAPASVRGALATSSGPTVRALGQIQVAATAALAVAWWTG